MFYSKQGFPEENEIVMCTVTKVLHNSAFADLNEYKGKQGMIPISEISPGRIRNIRDFVRPGKVVICKVLRVNKVKGYIDLSLRRVNEGQKRNKVNEIKQEQLAEKIVEFVAKQNNVEPRELYNKIFPKIVEDYEYLYDFFEDVVKGDASLDKLKLDPKIKQQLHDTILQRIKPKVYTIKGILKLTTYDSNGINLVKDVLMKAEKKGVKVFYKGGGAYNFESSNIDVKEAKKVMDDAVKLVKKNFSKHGSVEFELVEA